ncbi:type II secretion system minor pseudopilin GspI [Superficieibacter sp.]|uniref:type II secretion system minor pseudopilin GspI n=1 Tax=Superficieibacter sp. TaxID=2303322 RepID=UPI0028ADE888|nr:type II secretion system minor pseudopilin GspI [Superficieibacter sp.]
MTREKGMSLLEVLLAMSIFAAVALVLIGSMQGQANAIARMRNETFSLWAADALLQSTSGEEKAGMGETTFADQPWSWRRETKTAEPLNAARQTVTVTLPDGQSSSLTRYRLVTHEK